MTTFTQRGKKRMEGEMGQNKTGSLRLWIAAQKVAAQARLDRARQALAQSPDVVYERQAANMTGQLAVLNQVDAILAGEVEIPEPDLPAEPDSEDEAMHRQDCDMPTSYSGRHANGAESSVWQHSDGTWGWCLTTPDGVVECDGAKDWQAANKCVVEASASYDLQLGSSRPGRVVFDALADEPDSEVVSVRSEGFPPEFQVVFDEGGAGDGTVYVTVFADKATGHIHQGPSGKYEWRYCPMGEEAQTGKADSLQEAREQMEAAQAEPGEEQLEPIFHKDKNGMTTVNFQDNGAIGHIAETEGGRFKWDYSVPGYKAKFGGGDTFRHAKAWLEDAHEEALIEQDRDGVTPWVMRRIKEDIGEAERDYWAGIMKPIFAERDRLREEVEQLRDALKVREQTRAAHEAAGAGEVAQ